MSANPCVSMTGFGKASAHFMEALIAVEIRTLNHRFLEVNARLPRRYATLEMEIRAEVAKVISRGKVEVHLVRQVSHAGKERSVMFQRHQFDAYLDAYRGALAPESGVLSDELKARAALAILSRSDVLAAGEDDSLGEGEAELVLGVVRSALTEVTDMRRKEGSALRGDITGRLEALRTLVDEIQRVGTKSPEVLKERIVTRLRRLSPEVSFDDSRLLQEAALVADRIDITEEVTRFRSHLEAFSSLLSQSGQGKRLDFLTQELGRECNTMGSKAQDAVVQQLVVSVKVELERIREQLQNVE